VQDVGLIFLSAMATSIAGMSAAAGRSAQEALGTTLVTLVIATFLVGSLIVLVGAPAPPSHACLCCGIQCIKPCAITSFEYFFRWKGKVMDC